ncbi:MAG: PKD domain-containing protein [Chloroflexi bacterium]|nr:PKD domain-containing protein [Chloroflexota bacterium]
MKIYTVFKLSIVIALVLQVTACIAPQQPPKVPPATTKPAMPQVVHDPVIKDIAGLREWTPSTEGELTCYATDYYGRPLTYSWATDNGTIKGEGQKVTWITPDTVGDCVVTVKVSNNEGGSASFSKTFKVTTNPYGNLDPSENVVVNLKLFLSSNDIVKESATVKMWHIVEIKCVVQNEDPNTLIFRWSVPGGKLLGTGIIEGKASSIGWVVPGVGGQYTVTVLVTDKTGREARGQVDFNVVNEFN